jgi:hypothetical protein
MLFGRNRVGQMERQTLEINTHTVAVRMGKHLGK